MVLPVTLGTIVMPVAGVASASAEMIKDGVATISVPDSTQLAGMVQVIVSEMVILYVVKSGSVIVTI